MGSYGMDDPEDTSPYPPRQDGYVNCLTLAQEAALKELCGQLPEALCDLASEHLTLWGVSLADLARRPASSQASPDEQPRPSTNGGGEPSADADGKQGGNCTAESGASARPPAEPTRVQSVVLLKFLRARQFNVTAALEMLVKCLKWRRDFDVAGLSLENFPQQLAAAGQLSGRDRAGNPVTYNYYGKGVDLESVFTSPGGVATFVRWRVKLMEQAVGLLDFKSGTEHVTQVHDYSGASMFRMDAHVKAASREIIRLFQDNYPEMLSAKLFLNVPRVMEFLYGIFTAFSDAATRAKFVMASPARARAVLAYYVDPAQAPVRFGGFLETCSVPPKSGRPAAFNVTTSKHVTLKPGESHVTSKIVGPDSEVVWGFFSTGPELQVSVGFRPRDNGEAAAAAARQPDHVAGTPQPNSPHRDAQHITESHNMTLAKEAASGRLVLGCAGEVVMSLENPRTVGLFASGAAVTVHYVLLASGGVNVSGRAVGAGIGAADSYSLSEGSASEFAGGLHVPQLCGAPGHKASCKADPVAEPVAEGRVLSYMSFGCASLTSVDEPDLADASAAGSPSGRAPTSPLAAREHAGGGGGGLGHSGRFETVVEADESGAITPARTTVADLKADPEGA